MKICIDDGPPTSSWHGLRTANAATPSARQLQVGMVCAVRWHAARELHVDGVRYGFDPVSDRFVQTTDRNTSTAM